MPVRSKVKSSSTSSRQLRLRVFAGPNGSGKSTVIRFVKGLKVNGKPIDFGYYINADDIAGQLRSGSFSFNSFRLKISAEEFRTTAIASGLINQDFNEKQFSDSFLFRANKIRLKQSNYDERLAQIISDFLRKKLLAERRKYSFETVFSHRSKLAIMQQAADQGYKVYLYFVSTESPEINKFRVDARKQQGGHDVPAEKIETRYYRSLDLLFEACQLAYQVFFFDNSLEGQESVMFAHFKMQKGRKKWDPINEKQVPIWFRQYYSSKVKT